MFRPADWYPGGLKTFIFFILTMLACAAPARAVEAFPKTLVFQPLLADPRWPAFLKKIGLADDQLK